MLESASHSPMKNVECAPGTGFGFGKINNNSDLHGSKNLRSPFATQELKQIYVIHDTCEAFHYL